MIKTYLYSFGYSGLMYPVAFLRIYLGYVFLSSALEKINSDYLVHPLISAKITEWLPYSSAPDWFKSWLELDVIPNDNWKILAYVFTYLEFFIGVSFLFGLLVRMVSIMGMVLMLAYILIMGLDLVSYYKILLFVFMMFCWVGAGRCIGLDYFFYKKYRGLLW